MSINQVKQRGLATLIGLLAIMVSSCTRDVEGQVTSRFQEYMKAWHSGDVHRVWELTSPKIKSGNGSEEHFTKFIKAQNIRVSQFTIGKVEVRETDATIFVKMVVGDFNSNQTIDAGLQRCHAILDNGLWYIDGCKPAN